MKMQADDPLYVPCPRCRGHRMVFATTYIGDGYTPSRGEYFTCPLCYGTGEADREEAAEWTKEQADAEN